MNYPTIILKKGKEKSLERFHPWIFSGAIQELPENLAEGDFVQVRNHSKKLIGVGYYQAGSISVRMLSFKEEEINEAFWERKLLQAIELRKVAGLWKNEETNVFRLINGEGDGFPSLIVDYYDGCVVFQAHTVGMYRIKDVFVKILQKVLSDQLKAVYDKSGHTLAFDSGITHQDAFLFGEEKEEWRVKEYGNEYNINVVTGQKTGFFVDQRENRKLLETYSRGKKVLNTFCYSGGFSVAALKAGAELVHSVDSSKTAIELTDENIKLNFDENASHESFCKDVFSFLNEMPEQYDVIVLDPPAFAKHRRVLNNGLKGYRNINEKAFRNIKEGGVLFTFSCSQVVTNELFRIAVFSAAASAGREVQIIHQLHQPADHPVSIYHPEGEYLKGLVLRVW
ncbi:class I SAM-dependent rRNA methyltransferase [Marivirga sp. S37H4]|uniref:Class I SAM-dependent rRNA methyltransferase n=1 Tax=Marivirga aurantiaca TaxID=2802615 RepID=A0A935CA50_9BACT|nr:class I SAM-dependent rRNA methyltransferase [Marivirga aurantiaca]MBK6266561.1 class I SAM-dependent rRNA methyltransferase [Marivirga aurantiaca]